MKEMHCDLWLFFVLLRKFDTVEVVKGVVEWLLRFEKIFRGALLAY